MTNQKSGVDGTRTPLFTFAVIADTHLNPEDDRSSSPWQTNRLANGRTKAVIARLNALDPDLVVHLGDMVHPVPAQPNYRAAAERYRVLFADLRPPLHVVPGNHDLGDKPTLWMPAASINPQFLELYRMLFGRDFYAFEHKDCRFIVLNSQLFNSGLPDEQVQWDWLSSQLNTGQRIFLFQHYPPFLHRADEIEHYDNIAEPARSRLIALLRAQGRVEALFCGHVHNFFYNRIGSTDCYVLPAISAVRHDYMELFPVPPTGAEYGRDARSKLGFFLVEIFPDRHVAHWIRTWGEIEPSGPANCETYPVAHPRSSAVSPLGIDLRHGWAEPVAIPYTGVVDEFGRKRVRNDYVVAALSELGIRNLRIPVHDLVEPATSRRIVDLAALGFRFAPFTFGLPDERYQAAITQHADILSGLELIERAPQLRQLLGQIGGLRSTLGVPIFLSSLHDPAENATGTRAYGHSIRHGFRIMEGASHQAAVESSTGSIDGLVFRVERDDAVWPTFKAIVEFTRSSRLRAIVNLRLAGNDPVRDSADDAQMARLVADATLAAWAAGPSISVYLDTLADHDRGYFPRLGLMDRACDLRPAGNVLRRLVEEVHLIDWRQAVVTSENMVRLIRGPGINTLLVLAEENFVTLPDAWLPASDELKGTRLDTGSPVAAFVRRSKHGAVLEWTAALGGMPFVVPLPARGMTSAASSSS